MKIIYALLIVWFLQLSLVSQVNVSAVNSGNWNNASTWSSNTVPTSSNDITIGAGISVTINANAFCNKITISNAATLTSNSSAELSVSDDWMNSGIFVPQTGTVNFSGANNPQSIGGNSLTVFGNIRCNNSGGVSLAANSAVKNSLTIVQGTFNTAGYQFTFLSDSNGTAALASIPAGANISGNITVQRYMSSSATGWRFLGSPVQTNLQDWNDDFITSGFPGSDYPNYYWCSIYSYDETVAGTSEYGYVTPTGTNNVLNPGTGYWCWIGPTPTVVSVTGPPATFDFTFNVTLTPDAGKGEDGWNMVANPYPSAIDWDSQAWTKSGIVDAVYIWDPALEQYSTYIEGVGVNGGSNIIPSCQAFWIEANQSGAVFTCNEQVKTLTDKVFQKASKNQANDHALVKLVLSGNGFKDETALRFSNNSQKGIDGSEDALKLFSDNPLVPSITSIADTSEMVVNSLPYELNETSVPVKVKVGVAGTYTISRGEKFSVPANACVYLEDLLNGNKLDLKTLTSYTFNISDTTGSPRFMLRISRPMEMKSVETTCSYNKNGKAIVTFGDAGSWNVIWKNEGGVVIASRAQVQGSDTLGSLAPGNYFVSASDTGGKCSNLTSGITVMKPSALMIGGSITDNKCLNENNGVINVESSGGKAPYTFCWSNGQKTARIDQLASGTYTIQLTDANGCRDTAFYQVKTLSAVKAAFKIQNDPDDIFVNDLVVFENESEGASTYVWYFGSETSGGKEPTHQFASPGTYTVVLAANDAHCASLAQRTLSVLALANEPEVAGEEGVRIFNDGGDAAVEFNMPREAEASITVYSMDGKVIDSKRLMAGTNKEFCRLGEASGIYLVSVQINGELIRHKLIK